MGEGTPIHRASIRTPTLRPHTTTLTRTRKRPSGTVGFVASKKKVRTEGESTAVPRSETGQFNLQKTLLERSEKYGVDITGLDIDDPIPEPTVHPPSLVIPRRRTLKDLKIIGTVSNKWSSDKEEEATEIPINHPIYTDIDDPLEGPSGLQNVPTPGPPIPPAVIDLDEDSPIATTDFEDLSTPPPPPPPPPPSPPPPLPPPSPSPPTPSTPPPSPSPPTPPTPSTPIPAQTPPPTDSPIIDDDIGAFSPIPPPLGAGGVPLVPPYVPPAPRLPPGGVPIPTPVLAPPVQLAFLTLTYLVLPL